MKQKHIIAMGGGGFSMEPDNLLLDRYVLAQTGKECPKVCFVPTASGDAQSYIDNFYASFNELPCEPSHLSLFKPEWEDLEAYVLAQDVIYVGGGNTRNLITLWREWGLDKILRKAWENGVVMAGISAGSLCWFEEGVTDSLPYELSALKCLGFLQGSNCPHYDGEFNRRPSYHQLLASGQLTQDGIACDDGAALHYVGTELKAVVSSRPNAKAYTVRKTADGIVEEALEITYLG